MICAEYDLPVRDGLSLLKKVKSSKSKKQLPSILLQKQYDPKVLQIAFAKGVDDYYTLETHSHDQIIERIKSLIESSKQTQKDTSKNVKVVHGIPWSKRLFDIVVASLLLLVLSPLLLITMIAIRLESNGKVYYTAKRVGRKTFDFYKFRSMRVGADKMLKQLAKKEQSVCQITTSSRTRKSCLLLKVCKSG